MLSKLQGTDPIIFQIMLRDRKVAKRIRYYRFMVVMVFFGDVKLTNTEIPSLHTDSMTLKPHFHGLCKLLTYCVLVYGLFLSSDIVLKPVPTEFQKEKMTSL